MEALWFCLTAFLLVGYVVLDGFDLGAGVAHLLVAKTDDERRSVLASIGPVWDGNEVWLLAAGGTLYFAFPKLYASAFSGFYLPLMLVLWLLILRGCAIEFRNHLEGAVWKPLWDVVFAFASGLLALFFGVALGNVVRGVPLNAQGDFFLPLWAANPFGWATAGVLDGFTVLVGLLSFAALSLHGILWVHLKTEGAMQHRAKELAQRLVWLVAILTLAVTAVAFNVQAKLVERFSTSSGLIGLVFPVIAVGGLVEVGRSLRRSAESTAFIASCVYLVGMLASVAFGLFPVLLPALGTPGSDITAYNAAAPRYGLSVGLVWWIPGVALAVGYAVFLYRKMAGKVSLEASGH